MSLYSFFYPAEYAEDVTESDALRFDLILTIVCQQSALGLAHENRPKW